MQSDNDFTQNICIFRVVMRFGRQCAVNISEADDYLCRRDRYDSRPTNSVIFRQWRGSGADARKLNHFPLAGVLTSGGGTSDSWPTQECKRAPNIGARSAAYDSFPDRDAKHAGAGNKMYWNQEV